MKTKRNFSARERLCELRKLTRNRTPDPARGRVRVGPARAGDLRSPEAHDREAFADIGIRLPLFNRNQGGIAAAEADLAAARLEEDYIGTLERAWRAAVRVQTLLAPVESGGLEE